MSCTPSHLQLHGHDIYQIQFYLLKIVIEANETSLFCHTVRLSPDNSEPLARYKVNMTRLCYNQRSQTMTTIGFCKSHLLACILECFIFVSFGLNNILFDQPLLHKYNMGRSRGGTGRPDPPPLKITKI